MDGACLAPYGIPDVPKMRYETLLPRAAYCHAAGSALGCALHLAATGDQGFSRRLRLARPLLQQVRHKCGRKCGRH
eukprot:1158530-Pelagomonas_calceolata.AAC.6